MTNFFSHLGYKWVLKKWLKPKPKPNIEWKSPFSLKKGEKMGWQWWIKYLSEIVVEGAKYL